MTLFSSIACIQVLVCQKTVDNRCVRLSTPQPSLVRLRRCYLFPKNKNAHFQTITPFLESIRYRFPLSSRCKINSHALFSAQPSLEVLAIVGAYRATFFADLKHWATPTGGFRESTHERFWAAFAASGIIPTSPAF